MFKECKILNMTLKEIETELMKRKCGYKISFYRNNEETNRDNADKLFEELGYNYKENAYEGDKLTRVLFIKKNRLENTSYTISIADIGNNEVGIKKSFSIADALMPSFIDSKELKAINKKVEELGWEE